MDLVDYIVALRKRIMWVLMVTVLGAVAGGLIAGLAPPRYSATATTLLSAEEVSEASELPQIGTYMSQQIATLSTMATTETVLQPVIDELGLDTTPLELANRVSVVTAPDTMLINISTSDDDPQRAADTSNAIAEELSGNVDQTSPRVGNTAVTTMEIVTHAPVPTADQSTSIPVGALAGAIVGFLVGLIVAVGNYAVAQRRAISQEP